MASELRVNTLKDAAGNNSVGMEYVANGSGKAWNCFNASGTISLRDSLNTASLTDNGLSNFDTNFTNSFANDDYSFQATNQNPIGGNNQMMAGTSATSKTTGEFGIRSQNYAGTFSDVDGIMTAVYGDLA